MPTQTHIHHTRLAYGIGIIVDIGNRIGDVGTISRVVLPVYEELVDE